MVKYRPTSYIFHICGITTDYLILSIPYIQCTISSIFVTNIIYFNMCIILSD